jgi:rubrerythrin
MYPAFIEQSRAEGNGVAETSFVWANKVEKIHHALYEKALQSFDKGESLNDESYFVCQNCGYTVDGEAPEKCPVCGAPRKMFKRVD